VLICKSIDFCCCMLLVYYLSVIVCFPIMQDVSVKNWLSVTWRIIEFIYRHTVVTSEALRLVQT